MMKHTLFALAGAMATIALASDPSPRSGDLAIDGFENYTAGQPIVSASANWTGSSEATVRAYGDVAAPQPPIVFPQPFTNAVNNYLEIDSGSEEVTNIVSGATQDVVYIDTLAQFSVLKNGDPEPTAEDAKILLWLQEDVDGDAYSTNLYVKGGYYGDMEHPTPTTYKLNKTCQPGVWYRVTIAAYKNIVNDQYAQNFVSNSDAFPAFVISIDGTEVATTEPVHGTGFLEEICPVFTEADINGEDCLPELFFNLMRANKLIPAIGGETAATVSQVAFKGTGAVDDLVVTALDPAQTYITFEWPSTLTTVFYMVGDTTNTLTVGSSPATIVAPGSPVTLHGGFGDYVKEVSGSSGTLTLPASEIDYFFPRTATAGQDGTAEHPFEIADVDDLVALKDAVASLPAARSLCYVQTADIDFTGEAAFAGIGTYGDAALTHADARPFTGTYDGQGHKISDIIFTDRDYAGVFNRVDGGTVKNLVVENISYVGTGSKYCASIIGYALNGATLENLTSAGTFGSEVNPGKHNMAGIVIRVSGGTSGDGTQILNCTNNATIYGQYTKLAGICAISQEKITSGDPKMVFTGCANNGTLVLTRNAADLTGFAGIVGYSDVNTTMTDCSNNGNLTQLGSGYNTDHTGALIGHVQGHSIADGGGNSAPADKKMIGNRGGTITGFQYATVDNSVATTVSGALAAGNTYLLEGNVAASETPVATLTAVGDWIAFDTALGYTFAGTVAASGAAGIPTASTSGTVTTYTAGYFPRTATAGQDGSTEHPFEIADLDDLQALRAAVANAPATYAGLSYVQTADIALTEAWEGIGFKGGKDHVSEAAYDNGAFTGVYDGGNYTISNFQMESGTDYGALFNSVYDATIKNLKISYKESKLTPTADTNDNSTGATFVGVAKSSTLQNLTALAGTVTTVSAYKDMGGIVGYLMAGSTVESCTNELNVASTKGGRKCGGIAIITQGGSGTATIRNCKNSGTTAGGAQDGGIVGYIGIATLIDGCENTADAPLLTCQSGTVTVSGGTKSVANRAAFVKNGGTVIGLNFATVDGNVATFVADNALALNGEYKVMASGATATYAFAEAGTIAFDTALYTPTYAITAAEGLTLADETVGTVKTYTATAPASSNYKVEIDGVEVAITPTAEDLAALAYYGVDTTDVAAVNEALASEIGTTGIPVWQAALLGLPPTEAGLEAFAIKSIDFVNGNVTVTMADGVELKTGRGVDITLKVLGSNDLTFTTTSEVSSATNTKILPAITPALGETAKFYKVVVEFTATPSAD